jgi:isopentenyl-diphosphate delta-isomerase
MLKSAAHKDGTLHRIAVVYVVNDKGEILVQERADGHLDHSAAGHVAVNESYEEAAKRELFEELGVSDVVLEYVGHGMTRNEKYPGKISSHMFDIFSCSAVPGVLQTQEVAGVYWSDPETVRADMEIHPERYCEGFRVSLKIFQSRSSHE